MLLFSLLGCSFSPKTTPDDSPISCDPRELSDDEIRLRNLLCGDEKIRAGDLRRGDWILENNILRIGIREIGTSLSHLKGAGGSIVDLALFGQEDSLLEILPYQDDILNVDDVIVEETEKSIRIQIDPYEAGFQLDTNTNQLQFWGEIQWLFRPLEGTERIGKTLVPPKQDNVLYLEASIEDLGGDLLLSELKTIQIGAPSEIFRGREEQEVRTISSTGTRVLFYQQDELLGFLPVEDGVAQGYAPPETSHIQAVRTGCLSSEKIEISNTTLDIGDCGSLLFRLHSSGIEHNGLLRIDGQRFFISQEGNRIPFTEVIDTAIIDAGLEFEPIEIGPIDPLSNPILELALERVLPSTPSMSLQNLVANDPSIRKSRADTLLENIGLQIDYALLSARNIVPKDDNPLPAVHQDQIFLEEGLLSIHAQGQFLSFPWTASKSAAFGAIPVHQLGFQESLEIAKQNDRFLILDYTSRLALSPEQDWTHPSFLHIKTVDEAIDFAKNCGEYPYSKPISDHIWFPNLVNREPSKTELESELYNGSISLGNGPLLHAEASLGDDAPLKLNIFLHGNSKNRPTFLTLYSEEGEEQQWELSHYPFEETIEEPNGRVFCLVAWSEDENTPHRPWALSTPIYASEE